MQTTYLSSLRRVQAGNVALKCTAPLLLLLFFCSCWSWRGFHVGLAIKHSNFFWSFNELQSSPLFLLTSGLPHSQQEKKKKTVSHFFLQTLSRGWPKEEKLMFSSTLFRLLRETSMGLGLLPLSRVVELVGYSTNYGSMLKLKRGGAGAGYLKWRELPLCMRSAQCHWRGRLTVSAIKWHSKELLG